MSDLLSLLGLGSAGLLAQRSGVAVATNNAANVNTVGYSRQRVDLNAEIGAPEVGGVSTGNPRRIADDLLANRERDAAGGLGLSKAVSQSLLDLEQSVAGTGPTLDQQIANVFGRLNTAAATPLDDNLRSAALTAARDLVSGINQRAAATQAIRTEFDARVRDAAKTATGLAADLAKTNDALQAKDDPVLRDRRDQDAKQLAAIVGGSARIDPDGQMRFVLEGGAVLVDGTRAAQVQANTDPATHFAKVEIVDGTARRDVTGNLQRGEMAGYLQARDQDGAQAANSLDQLASDLATSVNAIHSANAGTDGVTGRNLFTPLAGVAGAAAALTLDPTVAADPRKLALAGPGAGPGDNAGARALVALKDSRIAAGGTKTLGDAAIDLVQVVGTGASRAKDDMARDTALTDSLGTLRNSVSGVDLDEELANLSRFQHASEAMTKFVSTVDSLLGSIITGL